MDRSGRIGARALGLVAALAMAGALADLGRPDSALAVGVERSCETAMLVDGVVRCDEELGAFTSARAGDALEHGVVIGRMPPRMIAALDQPVDVNCASPEELDTLPRIGPALAARIVEARPFAAVDELDDVRGIGRKTLGRLRARARVYVEPRPPADSR